MLREGMHKSGFRLKREFLIWYQITPFMVIAVTSPKTVIELNLQLNVCLFCLIHFLHSYFHSMQWGFLKS